VAQGVGPEFKLQYQKQNKQFGLMRKIIWNMKNSAIKKNEIDGTGNHHVKWNKPD
jgi:hypothetical protein